MNYKKSKSILEIKKEITGIVSISFLFQQNIFFKNNKILIKLLYFEIFIYHVKIVLKLIYILKINKKLIFI